MPLIVGLPIANRAWALPHWFECLAAQTRRPDGFVFVHSGHSEDDTWRMVQAQAAHHRFRNVLLLSDWRPPHPRHDTARFHTLASLRNRALAEAETRLAADLYLSLDSDIMLEDPRTIEHLAELVCDQGFDIASPATFFHPAASDPQVDADLFWAYNAAWWAPGGRLDDPQRAWLRPEPDHIDWGQAIEIQIPMGVWLGNAKVFSCQYRWHESGEDLGFAQDIDEHGLRVIWDTSLRAKHVWCEQHSQPVEAAA